MNLFLVPATEGNITHSVSAPVASHLLQENLERSQLALIEEAYGDYKSVRCFAMTGNSEGTFRFRRERYGQV